MCIKKVCTEAKYTFATLKDIVLEFVKKIVSIFNHFQLACLFEFRYSNETREYKCVLSV